MTGKANREERVRLAIEDARAGDRGASLDAIIGGWIYPSEILRKAIARLDQEIALLDNALRRLPSDGGTIERANALARVLEKIADEQNRRSDRRADPTASPADPPARVDL